MRSLFITFYSIIYTAQSVLTNMTYDYHENELYGENNIKILQFFVMKNIYIPIVCYKSIYYNCVKIIIIYPRLITVASVYSRNYNFPVVIYFK